MILSEKLTELRKRAGLSQEAFGAEIGVSRQAVSKWELAQAVPDLNKIIAISQYYGVPTDFLLNEEYDLSFLDQGKNDLCSKKTGSVISERAPEQISLSEIQAYLGAKKQAAQIFVTAVFLFFLSPVAGILLSVLYEKYAIAGILIQILMLAVMSVLLVITIRNLTKYRHFSGNGMELAYGVRGIVLESRKKQERSFLIGLILGVIGLIACVIPMVIVSAFTNDHNTAIAVCGCIMLFIFAVGLSCIVYVLTIDHGYKRVLKIT